MAGCNRSVAPTDLRPIPGQNVLLVTIDTLRADALGCYGGPAATPALDRLAADGIRFDFAHAHAVTTLPSHASILTGTYPFQHGIRDNSGYRLRPNARTVATLLHAAGYSTAAFVGAFPLDSRFGLNQGFDRYDDRLGDAHAPEEFVMPERPASAVVPLARAWILGAGGAGRADEAGRADAAGRVGGAGGADGAGVGGWFAWVHLFDPHAPYRPPPPFDAQYSGRPYYGEVAAVDAALAPVFEDLRQSARSTLVIVTGDHGEALGDHGEQTHGLFAYESTLRIPLIVSELGGGRSRNPAATRGKTSTEVSAVAARHVDILPTILAAVGLAVPGDLPGRSLLTRADRADESTPRPSYFEAMSAMLNRGWAPLTGLVVDREKYVDVPIPERYDLAADRAEASNLFGRAGERDRALQAALRGLNSTAPEQRQVEDADASARLRALGYLSGNAAARAHYTEADDPKRLVALDQAVHDAITAFTTGETGAAQAMAIYEHVIAQRPDMAIAYRHLAFIDWQRGDANGAIAVLRRAAKAGVADPRVIGQLGGYLTDAGHMAEGIRLLESVAGDTAADLDSLNALGIAYARTGRADAARAIFERILGINPASSVPLENLGLLALERGDVVEARRQFERAIASNPRSSRAYAGLGNVALKTGNRAAAIDSWKRAVQLDPANFDALYNAGTALARDGETQAARPYLERFLQTAPPTFYAKDLDQVAALLKR
jgi:arylsulfatase A-like enzyme/Tfp pilus assembly protein PilF